MVGYGSSESNDVRIWGPNDASPSHPNHRCRKAYAWSAAATWQAHKSGHMDAIYGSLDPQFFLSPKVASHTIVIGCSMVLCKLLRHWLKSCFEVCRFFSLTAWSLVSLLCVLRYALANTVLWFIYPGFIGNYWVLPVFFIDATWHGHKLEGKRHSFW